jgi:hypothetical protein
VTFTGQLDQAVWNRSSDEAALLSRAHHSLQGADLSKDFLPRLGKAADQRRSRGHVGHHACLRSDPCSLAYAQVPSHPRLPADLNEVLKHDRARYADLRYDDAALAEAIAVPDLGEVSRRDPTPIAMSPVDGRVGTDFHVIAQDHASKVWDGEKARPSRREAEPFWPIRAPGRRRRAPSSACLRLTCAPTRHRGGAQCPRRW